MSPADLAVNLAGVALIAFIVWWFWLSHGRTERAAGTGPVEIVADEGVYTPSRIEVPAGRPVVLRFLRKDPSPCAEKVLIDRIGVAVELPVGEPRDVVVTLPEPGEYEFTCDMRMYRGVLVAR